MFFKECSLIFVTTYMTFILIVFYLFLFIYLFISSHRVDGPFSTADFQRGPQLIIIIVSYHFFVVSLLHFHTLF